MFHNLPKREEAGLLKGGDNKPKIFEALRNPSNGLKLLNWVKSLKYPPVVWTACCVSCNPNTSPHLSMGAIKKQIVDFFQIFRFIHCFLLSLF